MARRVLPLDVRGEDRYDLFVGAIGFESRSVHVAGRISADRKHFFPYPAQRSDVFARNMEIASSFRGSVIEMAETLRGFITQVELLFSSVGTNARVAIDISSFDRRRLAILLQAAHKRGESIGNLNVNLLYTPAEYSAPPAHLKGEPLEAGPVNDSFRGHLRRTSLPLAAVFGLGYEPQRAIGAFELLEPSRAWAFRPESDSADFSASLDEANRLLLSAFSPREVLTYPVLNPGETFYRLESLVSGLSRSHRVVLVPMGPKVFAVCCLLLGLDDAVERPAVWRIGAVGGSSAVDVKPRGDIVGLAVEFERQ